jgi:hypothetical protein
VSTKTLSADDYFFFFKTTISILFFTGDLFDQSFVQLQTKHNMYRRDLLTQTKFTGIDG